MCPAGFRLDNDWKTCLDIDECSTLASAREGCPGNFSRPVVNFISVFCSCFLYKILAPKTTKLAFGFEILATKILYEK